jgi:Cdc6-like AAA superfamily ATPase
MFFGRQEILADILNNIHATNFAIFGPKRIGKTSLLHQIDYRLSHQSEAQFDYVPLLVSLHTLPEDDFFKALMRQMVAVLRDKNRYPVGEPVLQYQSQIVLGEFYDHITFYEDLIVLRAALDAQNKLPLRLVLLVDEGDALNRYSQAILAQLRTIFMVRAANYLKIVLTAEVKDNREWRLEGSPWSSIFGKQYHLTPFTSTEARRLITEPVPHYRYQPEAIELILERSQLIPRHIQNICRQAVVEMLVEKSGTITLTHVQTALTKLDDLPGMSATSMKDSSTEPLAQPRLAETKTPYHPIVPDEEE